MNTPLYNMLVRYSNSHPVPFHMPGHVMGRGLADLYKGIGPLDITEIPESDCLHVPKGVIREAQDLAAHAFGAGRTFFLVNGSTVGLHAMIHAAVKPGGKIIINRDAHVSVLNAITLLRAEPVYLMPDYEENTSLTLGCRTSDLVSALSHHQDVEAVLLTRPNYYGVAAKTANLAEITRSRGIPLLVDEAHGAHFAFSGLLPESSLELGVDACVQSLHKTLPAMTQTALLHKGSSSLVSGERLFRYSSMLQTTSPSYVLMASMDIAREIMEQEGQKLYADLYDRVLSFDDQLAGIRGVQRMIPESPDADHDFSRIVLCFSECGLTGFQAGRILRESSNILVEMADFSHVVLIVTPFHTDDDFESLLKGIRKVIRHGDGSSTGRFACIKRPVGLPERAMNPADAMEMASGSIVLDQACGKVCATTIIPYPPGIPLVCPGEVLSAEHIRYLKEIQGSGGQVHGIMDGRIQTAR